ncbi:YcaO-like family protein [Clostridium grantii]|uniref:YcaO-like family protein n=1 Tax=Clostridium grantii DSM 8605 TaxID=1121316 RepID=A0A1M5UPT8_9CLOT|nr:YcaO-like family protein [Clostridium grantii]SHH64896.1 YcaO-like family protein [Clostridium grantii DSM 8605]
MKSPSYLEFKDDKPLNTINKIRNILCSMEIMTVEKNWENSVNGFYSVSVYIEGTNIASNGKGKTSEFALASAYGELMERLQNMAYFRLSYDMSDEDYKHNDFYYAPDEKYFTIKEYINSEDKWFTIQRNLLDKKTDVTFLMKKWLEVSYENTPCEIVTIPYYDLNSKDVCNIPIKMISKMYMSNGMCAGNTPEEALVQGISEIFERAVNIDIIVNRIVPPTIPFEYLNKYKNIKEKIERIKSNGNLNLLVKDCSMDKNYPVVAVILINKDDQSYFVKFGAHPVFELALDRTLNELLQGQNIKNMMGMKKFSYKKNIKNKENNLMGILQNGSGYYPDNFFKENFSYKFKEPKKLSFNNNKEILDYLIAFVKKMGYSIMVRNESFLQFPTYHVIIPGFSEIEKFNDLHSIVSYGDYNMIKRYIRNLYKIDEDGVKQLLCMLNGFKLGKGTSVSSILNLSTEDSLPWYYSDLDLYKAVLYYKLKEYSNCKKAIEKFIDFALKIGLKNELIYFKCLRDYLGCKLEKMNNEDIENVLGNFYEKILIHNIFITFEKKERIFENLGELKCWNCSKCDIKKSCSYSNHSIIYRKLKDAQKNNNIDQNKIEEILI